MFTYKFVTRGVTNSLKIRITLNRKTTELSVPGISIDAESLANALSKYPRDANLRLNRILREWNNQIRLIRMDILENRRDEPPTLSGIRSLIESELFGPERETEPEKTGWESYYESYAASKRNSSYQTSCIGTLKKMRDYDKNLSKMAFEDVTLKWLNAFDEWMVEHKLSQNSRNIHFKNIRTCLNRAIDEELTTNYPFRRFKIRPEETRKRNLPVEELRRLFNYPCEPYQEFYRDMFKLCFFLIGINAVDMAGLTEITKEGRIEYRRAKTHKLYSIKVEPEAMEIIEKHRGKKGLLSLRDRWESYQDFTKNCNIALKKLGLTERRGRGGKKIITSEWPDISLYWARHSWATIARSKPLKISKDDIALALGHGKKTVTNIYIEEDRDAIDEANRRVIDWVMYGKS